MRRDLCLYEKRPTYLSLRIPQLRCESVDRQERGCESHGKTYLYKKRPPCMRRDLCLYEKRPMFIWKETYLLCMAHPAATLWIGWQTRKGLSQRRICIKEFCVYEKRPMSVWKEAYVYMKRDLRLCKETYWLYSVSRNTYGYMKRDLCLYEKRPMSIWKETYFYVKRLTASTLYMKRVLSLLCIWKDLRICKETYGRMKRDLRQC